MNNKLDDLLSEWVGLNALTPDQIDRIRIAALSDPDPDYEMITCIIKTQIDIIRENFAFMMKPWWIRDCTEPA
jgi:hypothetical protein